MNNRRKLLVALGAAALAAPFGSYAQQQGKVWRIGFLTGRKGRPDPTFDTVLQGLREIGYVEGKNIQVEYRASGGTPERTASIVAEIVQLKVDVIISPTFSMVLAAKQATKTIPIVGVVNQDPVAAGLANSLARPGGNVTGVARLTRELSGKRLELLKEMIPGITRIGVLWDANDPATPKEYEAAARALKVQLQSLEVRGPNPDLEGAFQSAAKGRVGALITMRGPMLLGHTQRIAELAIKHRLPAMYEGSEFIDAGGLISYSTNDADSFKRAAYYVDKILKGAKPGDLPIEQPTRFDLIINMKTAKAIGVKIPNSLMQRVDKLIE
jgi:putative ABC transport system substrate-binding protein